MTNREHRKGSHFEAGSGCYTCGICQKQTRETGDGESGLDLCWRCFDREGRRNTHTDYHHGDETDPECEFCKPLDDERVRERADVVAKRDEELDFYWAAIDCGATEEEAEEISERLTVRVMRARGAI